MPDIAERLREFVDTAQPSITRADIDEVLTRRGSGHSAAQALRRHKPFFVGSLAAAGIAVVIALLLTSGIATDPSIRNATSKPESASAVLKHAALAADSQQPLVPGPGEFLYVRLLDGSRSAFAFPPEDVGHALSRFYTNEVLEQWTSPSGPNRQSGTVVGQPEFITGADRQLWEEAGSPPMESGYSSGGTPIYYDVADLPTDPNKMAAYFASQTDLVQEQTDSGESLNTLWDFSTAATFLEDGASAQQRAALLTYMATIPGVTDDGAGTTLGTKLTGTVLAMPSTTPGYIFQVLIDQRSSEVLELRLIVSDPSKLYSPTPEQVAEGHAIAPLQAGQAQLYQDFLYDGIADSSSAVPSGAPALSPAWPFGTGREPLAGSAY